MDFHHRSQKTADLQSAGIDCYPIPRKEELKLRGCGARRPLSTGSWAEPGVRIELTTYCLQGSRSTCWTNRAFLENPRGFEPRFADRKSAVLTVRRWVHCKKSGNYGFHVISRLRRAKWIIRGTLAMIRSDAPEFFECAVLLNSFTYSNSLIPAHAVCCGKRINNLQIYTRV